MFSHILRAAQAAHASLQWDVSGRVSELPFGLEPVVEVVPILTTSGNMQCVRPLRDLLLPVRRRFPRFRRQRRPDYLAFLSHGLPPPNALRRVPLQS
jgi:hypothetical protein